MKEQCAACGGKCCGKHHDIITAPIIFPHELAAFEGETVPAGNYRRLKRRSNGECIHFSSGECTIYDRRPLECRLYPWIVCLDPEGRIAVFIDPRCPGHLAKESWAVEIPRELHALPKSWWEDYNRQPD